MGHYEDNLKHIAEPAAPSEREKAPSGSLPDWVALWFAEQCADFAHYHAAQEEQYGDGDADAAGIALGYAEYINRQVREQENRHVRLYAHTEAAADVLEAIVENMDSDGPMFQVSATIGEIRLGVTGEPEVVEIDGEETVVYGADSRESASSSPESGDSADEDEDEAKDSYADMKMAEAENEHLQRVEAEAEKRGINNRKTPRVNPKYR